MHFMNHMMLVSPICSLSRPFHHSLTVMILECKIGRSLKSCTIQKSMKHNIQHFYLLAAGYIHQQVHWPWPVQPEFSFLHNRISYSHHAWPPVQLLMDDPSPLQQPVCENEHSHLSSTVAEKQGVWSACCLCPLGVLLKSHGNFTTIYLFW